VTRRKKERKQQQPRADTRPLVHAKVAYVERDLAGASALVKPALLYADHVTIYSPVASLVRSVYELRSIKKDHRRALVALDLIRSVPSLAGQLDVDAATLEQLRSVLSVDPRRTQRVAGRFGRGDVVHALGALREQLTALSHVWEKELPDAAAKIISMTEADELMLALDAGAADLADLTSTESTDVVADSIRAAVGDSPADALGDVIGAFVARVVEMLTEGRTFPLLDASSAGLVRALEREAALDPSPASVRRGAEIHAAAAFMGYLPNFVDLRMDEVIDLRSKLNAPLVRFRSEIGRMSSEFEARALDPEFAREVDDAWRTRVEPALLEIRETLAEHGLLREVGSVALGDPRRLILEAGGVIAAAHGEILSLSGIMTAATAAAVPAADVVGRAVAAAQSGKRGARRNAFYFLHRVAKEAERHK
jgi:hypothetical protein